MARWRLRWQFSLPISNLATAIIIIIAIIAIIAIIIIIAIVIAEYHDNQ